MKAAVKQSEKVWYYAGGLAEVVSEPSPLTVQYFQEWFTGAASVGAAMQLLGLPYQPLTKPLLELIDEQWVVNLKTEAETLYAQTIFQYAPSANIQQPPRLQIAWWRLFNWKRWLPSLQILLAQARWIGQPIETITQVEKWVNALPKPQPGTSSMAETSAVIATQVWPVVIATGLLAEFYHAVLRSSGRVSEVEAYCTSKIARDDWFFKSIAAQAAVKAGQLSFEDFLHEYGLRADNDYELTCPRWNEIPAEIKQRIAESVPPPASQPVPEISAKVQSAADTYCVLQLLRSEAKRAALGWMNQLRQQLKAAGKLEQRKQQEKKQPQGVASSSTGNLTVTHGHGIPVSAGFVSGCSMHISSHTTHIPQGTIGIFANASPQFAAQFPKCAGLLFIKGGQTSHGSIVAREFRIPALIDREAAGIADGTTIQLDGTTGKWQIL